jgi:serine/threonine protein kinase
MATNLLVDALLIAARKHRLIDRQIAERLSDALAKVTVATPQELDTCLSNSASLLGDSLSRVRKLLPDAAMWDDYLPHRPLAHLATGGMGDIWLARDAQSSDLVVIKTMRADLAAPLSSVEVDDDGTVWLDTGSGGLGGEASPGSAMQRRIERESRITRQLQHPNIVRCRDHGLTRSGNLFMVLDYHGSGDLFDLINLHGRLSEPVALSLVEQVAGALEASHRLNLVHRDIKAGNIFLTPDGGAKLADFGFARSTRANRTQLTIAGSIIGSPSCMAPEQIEGRSDLDIRADLYALGCVLFQALIGTPPFTGSVQDMMRGHCSVIAPTLASLRSEISATTSAIVERLLRKDREQRYATPAELRRDLQAALAALGVRPDTRVPLPARPTSISSRLPSQQPTIAEPPPDAGATTTATVPVVPVTTAAPAVTDLSPITPAAPIPAPPRSEPAPPAAALALGDWLVLGDHDTTVALYARTRLTLGKLMGASVDICLRNYPEEQHRAECMRISRQHVLITSDHTGGFQVQDLTSANGTAYDGEALVGNRPRVITPGIDHQLDVAQVIHLRLRAVPSRSAPGCAALVLGRTRNRPGLAYALVREEVSLGGPGADVMLPGCPQGVAVWIAWNGRHWSWRRTLEAPWTPVVPGQPVDGGARRWNARAGDPEVGV